MLSDTELPKSVQSLLWSYDLQKLDLNVHKRLLITQVLNFGTEESIQWLFRFYGRNTVIQEANTISLEQWDKKSLGLWSLILGIHPKSKLQKMGVV